MCCAITSFADVNVKILTNDKKSSNINIKLERCNEAQRLIIPAKTIPHNVKWISIQPSFTQAKVGDKGYYILPNGMLGEFRNRSFSQKKHATII